LGCPPLEKKGGQRHERVVSNSIESREAMKATVRFWGLFCLFIPFLAYAQDFTGTYVAKSQGTTYTLVLRQDSQGKICGKEIRGTLTIIMREKFCGHGA
jgi:hypothetical protein